MKILFYFLLNPVLFAKHASKTIVRRIMPRCVFHRMLRMMPCKDMGGVMFPLDQVNPLTGMGIADTYHGYLTIENAVKAVLLNDNEVDVAHNIRRHLHQGDIFFDVGAHFGYFSALGMERVGVTGEVHMFEPAPSCFPYLDRLKSLNPDYRCVVNKVGVGDKNGEMQLFLSPPRHI